ncbi:MAG: hypothetical protein AB7G06_00400 [Bdellovibrionales bacterium]
MGRNFDLDIDGCAIVAELPVYSLETEARHRHVDGYIATQRSLREIGEAYDANALTPDGSRLLYRTGVPADSKYTV